MAKKQEYFVDFYKDSYGEREVNVEALWDKNGKELYNGAKAILNTPWGDEIGKVKVYQFITDKFNGYGYDVIYSYGFKPKKGESLWIEKDGSNIELI